MTTDNLRAMLTSISSNGADALRAAKAKAYGST